jgi:serine/threonine-protein kinase
MLTSYSRLSADLHPGYRLCHFLGNGGFGEVWSAQMNDGEPVALKFLHCMGRRGGIHELRSIQVILPLRHAHLVLVKRVWAARQYLVVSMELADGSLDDLLDSYQIEIGKPIPAEDLLPLMAQAADALDFLNTPQHNLRGQTVGIQHGDISPSNLLLFGQTVKLSDFGLTTAFQGNVKECSPAGKPDYAAPEVFKGRLSNRTDQYALAVTYCWLRSGRLPFPDTPETFETTYTRPTPDLSMLTKAERPVIERALAVQPRDRWDSCRDLVSQLMRDTTASELERCPKSLPERRKQIRHHGSKEASCRLLLTKGDVPHTARIEDICCDGIRLVILRPTVSQRAWYSAVFSTCQPTSGRSPYCQDENCSQS